jgi:hypothetical protein
MSILDRWKLGAKALEVARWAADVAQHIDPGAVMRVLLKVVEIERERRGIPGAQKLTELLEWFTANYPTAGAASVVIGYVKALVSLLNALAVFKK